MGTGLLKPNAATVRGKLDRTDDDRREAGFALYRTAISIGAFAGRLVTGWLGAPGGWHRGSSAAATGVTFVLAQYVLGRRHLADRKYAAEFAPHLDAMRRAAGLVVSGLAATAALAVLLAASGLLPTDRFVDLVTLVSVTAPVGYFAAMSASPRVPAEERGRHRPYIALSLTRANGFQAQTVKLYDNVSKPAHFGVNGAVALLADLVVMAAAPWLRRTMHPVHCPDTKHPPHLTH